MMCRVLEVAESGFQTWRKRPISLRLQADEELKKIIQRVHDDHHGRYGAPRIQAELTATGRRHSTKRVARLMNDLGLHGKTRQRFVRTTISDDSRLVAENVLARNFTPDQPNTVWVSDITYISTREGRLYLAVTMDLYARCIVGWAMEGAMPTQLPLDALEMAVRRRNPPPGLLHHSDRGSQYTSGLFQAALQEHQMSCSMSRKGEC